MEEVKVKDFDIVNDMVNAAAKKIWSKAYRMCWHVFGDFEDSIQVGWTALCARKSARDILAKSAENNKGLIKTIAYRGIIDYIRSSVGREDAKNCDKKLQLYKTTRYMDYYNETSHDGVISYDELLDFIIPIQAYDEPTIETDLIQTSLQKEIDDFLNSTLNRREKMIMDHIYKKDMNNEEVSKAFSLTAGRISQIKTKAINQARKRFANV